MGQEGSPGITSCVPKNAKECEGMNPHTPKWTPEFSKSDYKGKN
jgi:hypothetical protein